MGDRKQLPLHPRLELGRGSLHIRSGHGPANLTALLRRFAIGVIQSKTQDSVALTIQRLALNVRLVFGYLPMTENSRLNSQPPLALAG